MRDWALVTSTQNTGYTRENTGSEADLHNQPHGFKAVRLHPVASSILGHQNGDNWALHVLEAHDIGELATLLEPHLHMAQPHQLGI